MVDNIQQSWDILKTFDKDQLIQAELFGRFAKPTEINSRKKFRYEILGHRSEHNETTMRRMFAFQVKFKSLPLLCQRFI